MDATRAIQIAIARADLILCRVLALPWGRMALSVALSVALAAAVIHVVKVAMRFER